MKKMKSEILKNYLILTITMLLIELVLRPIVGFQYLDWALVRIVIAINFIGLFLALIVSILPRVIATILNFLFITGFSVYAFFQIGFNNSIGTFMSVNSSSQLDKVTSYIFDYITTSSWYFYLILIPLLLMIIYYIFFNKKVNQYFTRPKFKNYLISLGGLIILGALFFTTLILNFMQNKYQILSNKALFYYPETPSICVNEFGIIPYAVIDFKAALLGAEPEKVTTETKNNHSNVVNEYTRVIDDAAWEELIANEDNKSLNTLNNYYINRDITSKNSMTGYFKDKNLIVILMESVNNIPFLYPEYFPTLNKLYNEGWSWVNNYSPRNSCATGNNEMTVMSSLFTINNYCTANAYKNNVYPEGIFNLFNNAGYYTSSYHNYKDHYYYRKSIHPNMGSQKYYNAYSLGISVSDTPNVWPSDVELFTNSQKHYMNNDKFMTFFTTVTSHRPYTSSSEYGDLYLDMFDDLDLSTSAKRYLSKLKVLDEGLTTLLQQLTDTGKLDDTVIVLFADHYPYGLSEKSIASFLGKEALVGKERDKTPFIIYNSTITPQKYEDYTTIMNILPTIANLFDVDYDPRLYMGADLFDPDYKSLAIFADGSWANEVAYYDASNSKLTYKNPANTLTDQYVISLNQEINNKINMSNLAIKKDYFNYLFKEKSKYVVESVVEETSTVTEGEVVTP